MDFFWSQSLLNEVCFPIAPFILSFNASMLQIGLCKFLRPSIVTEKTFLKYSVFKEQKVNNILISHIHFFVKQLIFTQAHPHGHHILWIHTYTCHQIDTHHKTVKVYMERYSMCTTPHLRQREKYREHRINHPFFTFSFVLVPFILCFSLLHLIFSQSKTRPFSCMKYLSCFQYWQEYFDITSVSYLSDYTAHLHSPILSR